MDCDPVVIKLFDPACLMLLIRAGVEKNPGPGSGESDRSRPKIKGRGRPKGGGGRTKSTEEKDSEGVFACECGLSFSSKSNLNRHKTYICPLTTARSVSPLRGEKRKITPSRKFSLEPPIPKSIKIDATVYTENAETAKLLENCKYHPTPTPSPLTHPSTHIIYKNSDWSVKSYSYLIG